MFQRLTVGDKWILAGIIVAVAVLSSLLTVVSGSSMKAQLGSMESAASPDQNSAACMDRCTQAGGESSFCARVCSVAYPE